MPFDNIDDSSFFAVGAQLPVCVDCVHYLINGTCEAFPNGIVDDIWIKGEPHNTPRRGDGGITFKAREDQ